MDRFQNTRQPDREWWEVLWPEPKQVVETLGIAADDSLADIGCGDGYFTLPAAELVAPAPVYAIDTEGLVDEVAEVAADRELTNLHCIVDDARALASVLPEPVDVALIANTFHGVESPARFVREVYRSLRPDGRFVIVNWHDRPPEETVVADEPRGPPKERRLSPSETLNRVSEALFEERDIVELPPHHYALICERR